MPLANTRDLTDVQWKMLDDLIPEPMRRRDGRGRPWKDRRAVLNGILWVLRTGAPWADVPERYPSYQTCHRRFQQWVRSGVMKGILETLALDLKARGVLDVEEAFIDGSFAPAKKGALKSGRPKRGKGTKVMAVADRHGLPVAVFVESATPHEVKLAVPTLIQMVIPEAPQNLIGDNAYDSDKLDVELRQYGIELIAPHRSNRRNKSQDARRLRRYRRRWKVERLFAWLQNFRRLVVRYERYAENFLGMLHLGCCLILLRHI
ncbi:MAG: IS5 family transposase [Acidobacteria bacterium]|nr:MAG: IS5 family transposase [Acidobacteriota bacterium]